MKKNQVYIRSRTNTCHISTTIIYPDNFTTLSHKIIFLAFICWYICKSSSHPHSAGSEHFWSDTSL